MDQCHTNPKCKQSHYEVVRLQVQLDWLTDLIFNVNSSHPTTSAMPVFPCLSNLLSLITLSPLNVLLVDTIKIEFICRLDPVLNASRFIAELCQWANSVGAHHQCVCSIQLHCCCPLQVNLGSIWLSLYWQRSTVVVVNCHQSGTLAHWSQCKHVMQHQHDALSHCIGLLSCTQFRVCHSASNSHRH